MSRKEWGRGLTNIKDSVDALIQGLEEPSLGNIEWRTVKMETNFKKSSTTLHIKE